MRWVVFLTVALAASVLALATEGTGHTNSSYRYYGSKQGRLRSAVLTLDTAQTVNGHAAVWLGASSYNITRWVQAGIAYTGGSEPSLYIEYKRPDEFPRIVMWPWRFGRAVRVWLESHSARWRVLIDGHLSRGILMVHPARISTLEIYGDASGAGVISGKAVKG